MMMNRGVRGRGGDMLKLDVVRMLALLMDLGDCSKFILGPSYPDESANVAV